MAYFPEEGRGIYHGAGGDNRKREPSAQRREGPKAELVACLHILCVLHVIFINIPQNLLSGSEISSEQLTGRVSVNTAPLYRLCPSLGQSYRQKFLLHGVCTNLGLGDACVFFAT